MVVGALAVGTTLSGFQYHSLQESDDEERKRWHVFALKQKAPRGGLFRATESEAEVLQEGGGLVLVS